MALEKIRLLSFWNELIEIYLHVPVEKSQCNLDLKRRKKSEFLLHWPLILRVYGLFFRTFFGLLFPIKYFFYNTEDKAI